MRANGRRRAEQLPFSTRCLWRLCWRRAFVRHVSIVCGGDRRISVWLFVHQKVGTTALVVITYFCGQACGVRLHENSNWPGLAAFHQIVISYNIGIWAEDVSTYVSKAESWSSYLSCKLSNVMFWLHNLLSECIKCISIYKISLLGTCVSYFADRLQAVPWDVGLGKAKGHNCQKVPITLCSPFIIIVMMYFFNHKTIFGRPEVLLFALMYSSYSASSTLCAGGLQNEAWCSMLVNARCSPWHLGVCRSPAPTQ